MELRNVSILLLLLGLIGFSSSLTVMILEVQNYGYEEVDAIIIRSEYKKVNDKYDAFVDYSYSVNGFIYTGSLDAPKQVDLNSAEEFLLNYPLGGIINIHYNIDHPERSKVSNDVSVWSIIVLSLSSSVLALGIILFMIDRDSP
ncbi:MAG: DUF3592 domain-containing protein [Candidatus Heimdallarchaeota archaeon]|nr:DUF3592 domain-containing protein [Candidatus Heimdallarchaeota archaeon]